MTGLAAGFLSPPPNKAPQVVGSLRSYSPVFFRGWLSEGVEGLGVEEATGKVEEVEALLVFLKLGLTGFLVEV